MSRTARPPLKQQGWETDTFSRWRHVYCYLARAGAKAGIKTAYSRRVRHAAKQEIRNRRGDD